MWHVNELTKVDFSPPSRHVLFCFTYSFCVNKTMVECSYTINYPHCTYVYVFINFNGEEKLHFFKNYIMY